MTNFKNMALAVFLLASTVVATYDAKAQVPVVTRKSAFLGSKYKTVTFKVPNGGENIGSFGFTVPAGQKFMITDIMIWADFWGTEVSIGDISLAGSFAPITAPVLLFPEDRYIDKFLTGIEVGPGIELAVFGAGCVPIATVTECRISASISGYFFK